MDAYIAWHSFVLYGVLLAVAYYLDSYEVFLYASSYLHYFRFLH